LRKGRDKKVRPAVAVEIVRIDTHVGLSSSDQIYGAPATWPDGFELALPPVAEEEIGHPVIRYKEIDFVVVVEVKCHHAQSFGVRIVDSRFLAHLRESQVAIVAVEQASRWLKESRRARKSASAARADALGIVIQIHFDVAAHKEVE